MTAGEVLAKRWQMRGRYPFTRTSLPIPLCKKQLPFSNVSLPQLPCLYASKKSSVGPQYMSFWKMAKVEKPKLQKELKRHHAGNRSPDQDCSKPDQAFICATDKLFKIRSKSEERYGSSKKQS